MISREFATKINGFCDGGLKRSQSGLGKGKILYLIDVAVWLMSQIWCGRVKEPSMVFPLKGISMEVL
jgi:hypothetical protein